MEPEPISGKTMLADTNTFFVSNSCERGPGTSLLIEIFSTTALAANQLDEPQQNDGTNQRYQQGWKGNGVIDRPDTHERADKVTSQKRANNAHYDIQHQTLLRICMHDPAGDIPNERAKNEIYNDVHFYFPFLFFQIHSCPCLVF
jgi:hypothetical protein